MKKNSCKAKSSKNMFVQKRRKNMHPKEDKKRKLKKKRKFLASYSFICVFYS